MTSITALLRHFGFTIRDLAEVLGISHALLVMVDKGSRKPPAHLTKTLAHPLFAEPDTSFAPEPEKNPIEPEWLHAQLAIAQGKLLEEQTKQVTLGKKYRGAIRIIHHTRYLDGETEKNLVTDWWRWQREKALLWISLRNPHKEWEQERKLFLLEQEVVWLQKKISEK